MEIRRTTPADKEEVLALYETARRFMAENGNPNQWVNGYPGADQLEADMAAGGSYVCVREGKIVGTFTSLSATSPTIIGSPAATGSTTGLTVLSTALLPPLEPMASPVFALRGALPSAAISASIPIGTISPCRKRWKKTATGSAVRSIWRTAMSGSPFKKISKKHCAISNNAVP